MSQKVAIAVSETQRIQMTLHEGGIILQSLSTSKDGEWIPGSGVLRVPLNKVQALIKLLSTLDKLSPVSTPATKPQPVQNEVPSAPSVKRYIITVNDPNDGKIEIENKIRSNLGSGGVMDFDTREEALESGSWMTGAQIHVVRLVNDQIVKWVTLFDWSKSGWLKCRS